MSVTACWDCEKGVLREYTAEHEFNYGNVRTGKPVVKLRATFPVLRCESCGAEFTDWRAEEAKDAAVAMYLAGVRK
jgi:hypothetical protein